MSKAKTFWIIINQISWITHKLCILAGNQTNLYLLMRQLVGTGLKVKTGSKVEARGWVSMKVLTKIEVHGCVYAFLGFLPFLMLLSKKKTTDSTSENLFFSVIESFPNPLC